MLGETISHYRVLEKLGQGGMGEVYLAEDTRLGRKVALKFLAPELVRDREALARFRNEARAVAEFSHPNIATLHDVGEFDGAPFLVMEYLEGETLRARVARGPMAVDEVLRIGQSIAEGLAKAHSRGIVHRDIKSANVMLTGDDELKILDFGLAHRNEATQITRPGTTLGTVAYMSPEQAKGQTADARSDIWSVGVLLYECLTGQLPFGGKSSVALEKIKKDDPAPPTAVRTGVPLELERVILRCLHKDPDLRYQNAGDLRANLRLVASESGTTETRTGAASAPRSRRRIVGRISLLFLAVVVATTAWWVLRDRDGASESPDLPKLAVGDFRANEGESGPESAFGLLVHMGLLQSEQDLWVLDPQWLEHQRAKLDRADPDHSPSAIDVARAARASYVLHGRLSSEGGVDRAECMLLDVRSGRTVAAWSESAANNRALASLVANQTLRSLLPTEALSSRLADGELGTRDPDAWQAYLRARGLHAEERSDEYREALESAVAHDSTFALAAYDYAMDSQRIRPDSTAQSMAALAWRHRTRLDMQRRLLLEAKRFEFKGDLRKSADLLHEVNQRWPEDEDTAVQLISYLYFWMHGPEMNRVLDRSLSFFPDSLDLRWYNALGLSFAGDWRGAQREYEYILAREIRQYGADSKAVTGTLHQLAGLAMMRGEHDRAAELLSRVETDGVRESIQRAQLQYCRGTLDEALATLRARGADDPSHPDFETLASGNIDFGYLMLEAGCDREYLALTDSLAERVLVGEWEVVLTLFRRDRPDLIEMRYEEEEVLRPFRQMPAHVVIARAIALSTSVRFAVVGGDLEAARDSLEALTDYVREPGVPGGWIGVTQQLRAEVALAEGNGQLALEALSAWDRRGRYAIVQIDIRYRNLHAEALEAAGRLEEAADELQDLLERYAGCALAHVRLARVRQRMGETELARASYERFFELWKNADADHPTLLAAREEYEGLTGVDE